MQGESIVGEGPGTGAECEPSCCPFSPEQHCVLGAWLLCPPGLWSTAKVQ